VILAITICSCEYKHKSLLVKFSLGLNFELEPQFNEPQLATSLQDFGDVDRWNLTSSSILQLTVYIPICKKWDPIFSQLKGQMFGTLVVSGIKRELMTCVQPTWEVTCFLVLHGAFTAIEVVVKKEALKVGSSCIGY
nr:long-chain-alcohol O-fatty-acyltransferase-like [Tanacetum cinerariifolium]